jgi:predicted O-methyltransferase YrrM
MLAAARGYLERGGVADRVELVEGEALDAVARLQPPFDLAWVDAAKADYRRYLDRLLPLVTVGGLLVFDNVLWHGRVAEPADDGEEDAAADHLRAFNGYLMIHPQLAASVLPLGDGVALAAKLKPTILEQGGPY